MPSRSRFPGALIGVALTLSVLRRLQPRRRVARVRHRAGHAHAGRPDGAGGAAAGRSPSGRQRRLRGALRRRREAVGDGDVGEGRDSDVDAAGPRAGADPSPTSAPRAVLSPLAPLRRSASMSEFPVQDPGGAAGLLRGVRASVRHPGDGGVHTAVPIGDDVRRLLATCSGAIWKSGEWVPARSAPEAVRPFAMLSSSWRTLAAPRRESYGAAGSRSRPCPGR